MALAADVEFEGGGALDAQRAEGGQVQGLGVEAMAPARRVKLDGEGVHGVGGKVPDAATWPRPERD